MEGEHQKNLSIEYGFPCGTRLMGILHNIIHLEIYLPECGLYTGERNQNCTKSFHAKQYYDVMVDQMGNYSR